MKRFAGPLCVLLIAGCATDRLRREGVKKFEKGDYEAAIASLQEAVKNDPSSLELRYELRTRREAAVQTLLATADSARANGDGESAIATYERNLVVLNNGLATVVS